MLLKLSDLERIKRGEITVVFRRWNRPTVKDGGTLKTRLGQLRIGHVVDMHPDDVNDTDARAAGFADLAEFRRWLATMKPGERFQRIEVSFD